MLSREFRRLFSAWLLEQPSILKEAPQLPLIFQRSPTGERLNATSAFRYEAHPNQQWIHGVGPEASSLLQHLHEVIKRLDKLPAFASSQTISSAPIALTKKLPQRYLATQLITCKNAEQFKLWQDCSTEQKHARIAAVIEAGLQAQIDTLRPKTKPTDLKPTEIELQFEWSEPKLQSIRSKAYVRVVSCSFTLPCTLHGSWAAGPLNNKGYGNITKA